MKRFALALTAAWMLVYSLLCLGMLVPPPPAFAQAPPRGLQQSETGSGNAGYPPGSTPTMTGSTGTTAGTSAFLPNTPGQFSYLCGFSLSPGSATAAITISVQVQNALASPLAWFVGAPVTAAGTTGAVFSQTFTPCARAISVNSGVGVAVGALGAGGVNQTVNVWGYTQ